MMISLVIEGHIEYDILLRVRSSAFLKLNWGESDVMMCADFDHKE